MVRRKHIQSGSSDSSRMAAANIQESKRALGIALKGKVAVFVVEDAFVQNASVLLSCATLPETRLSEKSKAIGYSDFLSGGAKADIFIVQFPLHEYIMAEVAKALEQLREENPAAAVVVCAFNHGVIKGLEPLRDAGTVNVIEPKFANDFYLLEQAAKILGLQ